MTRRCPESIHWFAGEHDCADALRLPEPLLDAMTRHAEVDWPIEACGVLVGPPGGQPVRHVPMRNVAESERSYCLDPRDQLDLIAELDGNGEDILVVYHSHTHSGATASGVDEAYARQTGAHYLILSVRNEDGRGPVLQEIGAYACDGAGLVETDIVIEVPRERAGPLRPLRCSPEEYLADRA